MALAQLPDDGVNVYVLVPTVAVEITDGFHVPEMPLFDIVDKSLTNAPKQNGPTDSKAGVILSLITICKVVAEAHCPEFGVNV